MEEILDVESFVTKAVNEYSGTIYKVAFHITCNKDDAYDVCQDVFLRLFNNFEKIKDDEHLKAWLIRVAVNCAKSYCTKGFKKNTVPIDDVNENDLIAKNKEDNTIDKVLKLPEKYRVIIHLFYYQEMSIEEISDTLQIGKSAVKTRLSRGRKLLEKIIREEEALGG